MVKVWLLGSLLTGGLRLMAQSLPSNLPRADFPVPDGPVYAITEANGVIYLGGAFSSVGPNESRTALFDTVNGLAEAAFPFIDGVVLAAAPDGQGGWYLGGTFTEIGGQSRANLARIRADYSVDSDWNPGANDAVLALTVADGIVFAGGRFTGAGGEPRRNLAAFNAQTGSVADWNPDVCCDFSPQDRSVVYALVVRDGRVYAGGDFRFVAGQPRNNLVLLDAVSGAALPWPENDAVQGTAVFSLALDGDALFVGGRFQSMGAAARLNLAAVDATLGWATSWNPGANAEVRTMALSSDTLFIGGDFNTVGGVNRPRLAALDEITGQVRAWNPAANGPVAQLVVSGRVIYAGGSFSVMGGLSRQGLAAVDTVTAKPTSWNPTGNGPAIQCLAVNGAQLLASSPLARGAQLRSGLAAIDARTGTVLDWNPSPNQAVYSLAAKDGLIYAGGDFALIGGQVRTRLAAINAITGAVLPWGTDSAGPNGRVESIAVSSNAIYAAGGFTAVGPAFCPGLAAFHRSTGTNMFWRPFANRPVRAVLADDETVFAAGSFSSIGTRSRNCFAALDPATAAALPWNPGAVGATGVGWTMARSGDVMYVGGSFTDIGGHSRRHLAAVDLISGAALDWDPGLPSLNDWIQHLSITGNVVYVAGSFPVIGGQSRHHLAALDATTGEVLDWNPDPRLRATGLAVSRVEVIPGATCIGGNFTSLAGQRHPYFAVFPVDGTPQITRHPAPTIVAAGQPATLSVEISGHGPLSIQWQCNGTNIPGATGPNLTLNTPQSDNSGSYSVVVTNELGYIRSASATLTVVAPLAILVQPLNQTAAPGNDVTFAVVAAGSPLPQYQWKLNGTPIPGETGASLVLTNVQASLAGRYSVMVFNNSDLVESQPATLTVSTTALPFTDNFAARFSTNSATGTGFGSNANATAETGLDEPDHAGQPGGRSVWYSWIAPANGVATFHTRGSDFDTLLAAYTFSFFGGLTEVAADDDGGGFQTSWITFNAVAGTRYDIVVDGYGGDTGRIVLSWNLQAGTDASPRIVVPPASRAMTAGSSSTLLVVAESPIPLTYQWLRNGFPVAGATNVSLTLANFQAAYAGQYSVLVRNTNRSLESARATLEIGPDPFVLSREKFQALFLDDAENPRFLSVALGGNGLQIFHTVGAASQVDEPNPCSAPGGSSRWLRLRPSASGTLVIDTVGSSFDTLLAVYGGNPALGLSGLTRVACDNNSAPDGARSLVRFEATAGTDYFIAVDGVNAAQGEVRLNWRLGVAPFIAASTATHVLKQGASVQLTILPVPAIPAPTYEWRLNGVLIPNATSTSLNLNNLQAGQSGAYSVVARNSLGSVTNVVALVTVAAPIQLSTEWVSTSGRPMLRVRGPAGLGALVEATTNFVHWTPLKTNLSLGPIDFTDAGSTNLPVRFYRVVPLPINFP